VHKDRSFILLSAIPGINDQKQNHGWFLYPGHSFKTIVGVGYAEYEIDDQLQVID